MMWKINTEWMEGSNGWEGGGRQSLVVLLTMCGLGKTIHHDDFYDTVQ